MHLLNAVMATRVLTRNLQSEAVGASIAFGSVWFFVYVGISCFLVIFAGIMSGLTLGLMSLGRVDLEILERSGTSTEKKQAGKVPDSPFLTFASDFGSYRFRFDFGFFFFFYIRVFVVSGLCAATILPVVQKQHQLLVTLLLCNAVSMEVTGVMNLVLNWNFSNWNDREYDSSVENAIVRSNILCTSVCICAHLSL